MTIASTVTSKGQVTLPKEVRRRLNVETGDVIVFEERGNHFLIRTGRTLRDYRGFLKAHGPADADRARQAAKANRGRRSARHG